MSARPRGHPDHPEAGQASAEFVAILPALVVCALIAAHGVAAGWAVWSAASAARAGARAEHVGGDGADAALRALPGALRRGARVETDEAIEVTVRAPMLLPGGSGPALTVSSRLDPGGG